MTTYTSLIPLRKLPASLPSAFTYSVPHEFEGCLHIGQLVEAPLRKKLLPMVVQDSTIVLQKKPRYTIVPFTSLLTKQPVLTQEQLQLFDWMHNQYAVHKATLIKRALPEFTKQSYAVYATFPRITRQAASATKQKRDLQFMQAPVGEFLLDYVRDLAEKAKRSKQSLVILVPNFVALAALEAELANIQLSYTIIHGDLTPASYRTIYEEVWKGNTPIIIGTRKALFLPYRRLWGIVQLFAHDSSYKQWDQKPRYRVQEVAQKLSSMHGGRDIRQDVYPSAEDIAAITAHELHLIPYAYTWKPITILSREAGKKDLIPERMVRDIETVLQQGKRAILIAHTPLRGGSVIRCKKCGWHPQCSSCTTSLIRTENNVLSCPWCTHKEAVPRVCFVCKSAEMVERAPMEKTYTTSLRKLFPGVRIAEVRADVFVSYTNTAQMFAEWEKGVYDILIGGPSLAYGWLLPQVAFCSILSLESLLQRPGFQSREQAFHTIARLRSAGIPLQVLTHNPEHELLGFLGEEGYKKFFAEELAERKQFGFPPYQHLMRFETRDTSEQIVTHRLDMLEHELRIVRKRSVYRTTPPYMQKRGLYYGALTVKYDDLLTLPAFVYGEEWTVDPSPEDIQ